jgi:hypothetical protein
VTGASTNVVGTELVLSVLDQPVTITFTGSDPLTYAQVAAQIEAQSSGRLNSYVDIQGRIVIEALYPGLISTLTVLPSDAAILLGLSTTGPGSTATGKEPRIALVAGTAQYSFRDPFGSRDFHYRTRLLNSSTSEAGDFSISFSSNDRVGVELSSTVVGYVELSEATGKPAIAYAVQVYNEFDGTQVDGKLVVGGTLLKNTDESGRAEFTLVRGQRLTVSVQGTLLRVIETCEAQPEGPPLVSFVFPNRGGGSSQVFLEWKQGRSLKEYIRLPVLNGKLSLNQAAHSRILDHRGLKRRLTCVLQPGDELRFVKAHPGEM